MHGTEKLKTSYIMSCKYSESGLPKYLPLLQKRNRCNNKDFNSKNSGKNFKKNLNGIRLKTFDFWIKNFKNNFFV